MKIWVSERYFKEYGNLQTKFWIWYHWFREKTGILNRYWSETYQYRHFWWLTAGDITGVLRLLLLLDHSLRETAIFTHYTNLPSIWRRLWFFSLLVHPIICTSWIAVSQFSSFRGSPRILDSTWSVQARNIPRTDKLLSTQVCRIRQQFYQTCVRSFWLHHLTPSLDSFPFVWISSRLFVDTLRIVPSS